MKNFLLGTTVLVGAALLAGVANAETPKVTLGGTSEFEAGWKNDDLDAGQRSNFFFNRNVINVRVDAKSDNGLGYGAGMDLLADSSGDANSAVATGGTAKRTFLYVDGGWGRLEGGSDYGAEQTLKIDAGSIAHATGGISGDWTIFANSAAAFWATPDLNLPYGQTNLGDDSDKNLNKLTYYTPRFAGFQAGVSYVVNTSDTGQLYTPLKTGSTYGNILTGGLNYDGKFDQITFGLAATGERGENSVNANEDLRAWNVGGKVGFMGFTVAGSYGNAGAVENAGNTVTKAANVDDTTYWTLGGAYETGPFGASVTYLNSTRGVTNSVLHNDLTNVSVGVDYKLAPGLTPYAEANFYDQNVGGTATGDNKGSVILVGSMLSF